MSNHSAETDNPRVIFHIAEPDVWSSGNSVYMPAAFAKEGFVHLSTRRQVLATAQRYYAGRADLIVLAIDTEALSKAVVYENLLGGEQLFPHYYGAIPRKAVVDTAELRLATDGCFSCELLDK